MTCGDRWRDFDHVDAMVFMSGGRRGEIGRLTQRYNTRSVCCVSREMALVWSGSAAKYRVDLLPTRI
jgi:hypothetical protein